MPTVEVRKNIVLYLTFTTENSGEFDLQDKVPFIADELIIRQIGWNNNASTSASAIFKTNLVPDDLVSFITGTDFNMNVDLHFDLRRQLNGKYSFYATSDGSTAADLTGTLILHLEFVKYKDRKNPY